MVPEFFGSLVSVLEPETFVLMLIGIAVGFVVGVSLPGLGSCKPTRARNGGSRVGSARRPAKMCPSRWFTPTRGRRWA